MATPGHPVGWSRIPARGPAMPRRLLAPTNFTPAADRAVRYAADLAEATGAELELVHVCKAARERFHLTWTPAGFEAEQAEAEEASRAALQALADEFSARGVPTTATVVGPTEPAVALLDAAEDADLVVIATRGAAGDRPGLGPVASAVARHARPPVLLVDAEAGCLEAGLRVVVPVDLSEASAAALREARALAAALGGSVEVVHAVPDEGGASAWGGEPVADDEPEAARRLRYVERFVADSLASPDGTADASAEPPVHVHLAEGDPAEAVARFAQEEGADLVLAGRPDGRPSSLDRLLAAVGEAARCPTVRVPVR